MSSPTYYKRKANGLCGYCGRRSPRPGKVACEKCANSNKYYHKRWLSDLENRERVLAYQKEYHATPEYLSARREAYAEKMKDPENRKVMIEYWKSRRAKDCILERCRRQRRSKPCQLTGKPNIMPRLYGITNSNTVDKAHIVPRKGSHEAQIKDQANILNLSAEVHRLFDGGWILFAHDGRCIIHEDLDPKIGNAYIGSTLRDYTRANDHYMAIRRSTAIATGFRGSLTDTRVPGPS